MLYQVKISYIFQRMGELLKQCNISELTCCQNNCEWITVMTSKVSWISDFLQGSGEDVEFHCDSLNVMPVLIPGISIYNTIFVKPFEWFSGLTSREEVCHWLEFQVTEARCHLVCTLCASCLLPKMRATRSLLFVWLPYLLAAMLLCHDFEGQ